jgi:integrase
MRSLRSLFNQLRDEYNDESIGLIRVPNYPFRGYELPTVKRRNQGKSLTVDEMKKLIAYFPSDQFEIYARNMFLLMFGLIGINTKDLYFLPKQAGDRISFSRFKTSKEYSIRLEPEVKIIAEKYSHKLMFINACDRFSNNRNFTRALDIHLKKLAKSLEFDLPLATNHARHTWATIARNDCRISKDDVALCLGHEDKDNKVTDDYITYDYTIIDEANRKVLDLVYGIKKQDNNGRTTTKNTKKTAE